MIKKLYLKVIAYLNKIKNRKYIKSLDEFSLAYITSASSSELETNTTAIHTRFASSLISNDTVVDLAERFRAINHSAYELESALRRLSKTPSVLHKNDNPDGTNKLYR